VTPTVAASQRGTAIFLFVFNICFLQFMCIIKENEDDYDAILSKWPSDENLKPNAVNVLCIESLSK